jgi:hypothetical protein
MKLAARALGLRLVTFAAMCAALGTQACGSKSTFPASVPPPTTPPPIAQPAPFQVGTFRVDITPPPGVTTFGHGPDALVTEGYWTRIYCRVFVIEPTGGDRIALVPCDLPASSKLLHRTIASKVEGLVKTTRIFLSATHTHAGPAHYFDGQGYDGAESSRLPGFDENMVEFMAGKIADGIHEAAAHAKWAEMRSWHYERDEKCDAADGACGTWGLAWNRSPKAHALDDAGIPDNAPEHLCSIEKTVDPSLHVVRFDEVEPDGKRGAPIGEIVSFAMHPTVLPNTNRLIGADTAGALSRILERRLRAQGRSLPSTSAERRDPLAAVLNTNEGDMSPVWREGTKAEVLKVATAMGARVDALTAKPADPKRSAAIDARYAEIGLPDRHTEAGERTCKTAEVGLAVAYGACDHPTTDTSGIPPVLPPDDHECQCPKKTPLGPMERWLAGANGSFPLTVPLGVVRLGDNVIAFVPAELTIEAGRMVDDAVQGNLRERAHVWVGGLSNGYILYVATPAEYRFHGPGGACAAPAASDTTDRQSYEAGSTLYGPQTIVRLANVLGRLAKALDDEAESVWLTKLHELDTAGGTYVAWPSVPRFPVAEPEDPRRHALALCELADKSVCFQWADAEPGGTAVTTTKERRSWVYVAEPRGAGIGACDPADPGCDPSEIVDDQGTSLVTRARRMEHGEMIWATVWKPTGPETRAWGTRPAAFHVNDRSGNSPLASPSFTAAQPPPPCKKAEQDLCGAYENMPGAGPGTPLPVPPLPSDCTEPASAHARRDGGE